jgi:hypothetical protein
MSVDAAMQLWNIELASTKLKADVTFVKFDRWIQQA